MTARPPRRRRMPDRKALQRALKRSMANMGERIATRIFLLFAIGVIAMGAWMWQEPGEARVVAGMFIAIGTVAAIFSLNWRP